MIEKLAQDLRYGFRMLIKNPGFAAIVVITLALGMGANTAIFTILNAVLLRQLPYDSSERVAWIWGKWPGGNQASISPPDFIDYRAQCQTFEHLGAFANTAIAFNLTEGGEPQRVDGYYITSNFFQALGVKPLIGRIFLGEEEQAGRDRVVILSYGLWQRRFGGDPGIVNRTVKINSEGYQVVGVMPAGIDFPNSAELWVPLPSYREEMKLRMAHSLRPIGRLKSGNTLGQAQAEMDIIAARLEQQYPETNSGWGVRLVSLQEQIVGGIRLPLLVLFGATAFVLLIACVNVANLLLARSTARQKEIAIRTTLGAGRLRLMGQLFTESLLLSVLGGAIGMFLAYWGIKLLVAFAPSDVPRVGEISLDSRVFIFTLLLSVLTGVVFGIVPALQASKPDLNNSLKEGGRGSSEGGYRKQIHNLLVGVEIALALMLLISSGLMIRSILKLQEVNPGFNAKNVLTMQIALPISKYSAPEQIAGFYQQSLERIGNLPGVESAGMISELPLSGVGQDIYFTVEGRPVDDPNRRPVANYRTIAHEYFRAMEIPLLRGRYFTKQEELGAAVVIINDAIAKAYFPDGDTLGKHLVIDVGEPLKAEIVGIVGNVRHFSLEAEPYHDMYLPLIALPKTNLVVRTALDPLSIVKGVQNEIRAIDRDQPVANIRPMEVVVVNSFGDQRFRAMLLTIFAGIALLLAIVGVYGIMSYSVSQRKHEIGIRLALGAQPIDVIKLVVGHGFVLIISGLGAGLVGAVVLTRLFSILLFKVSATDPFTFASSALLLAVVGLSACFVPALRATKVDPMITLRQE